MQGCARGGSRAAAEIHVLPLKQELGQHLASRINVGPERAHVISTFRDWLVAEFTVHKMPLVGLTIRETRLRERTGVNHSHDE